MLGEPKHLFWNPHMYAKAGIDLIFQMICENGVGIDNLPGLRVETLNEANS